MLEGHKENFMKLEWKSIFRIGVGIFLLYLCIYYWKTITGGFSLLYHAAMPLLLGCVIAYIVNILMSFYQKHYFPKSGHPAARKSEQPVCMLGAFLSVLFVLAAVIRLVVPELVSCIRVLLAEVPGLMDRLADLLSKMDFLAGDLEKVIRDLDWNMAIRKAVQFLSSGIGSTVNFAANVVLTTVTSAVNLLIGVIFSIYLLLGKDRLLGQCERLLGQYVRPAWNEKLRYVLHILNGSFHKYIVGQCTEAVVLGMLCAVGMLIFRFPYAAMTGTVIGVTALIPVAGAYIGGAVGFLLILTESPLQAVLFLVYLVVLQQLEGNLIYPKVVGSSIGLPGIWVLAAVTVGGGVCGIVGMLFSVPLAAAFYQIVRNDVRKREGAAVAAVQEECDGDR